MNDARYIISRVIDSMTDSGVQYSAWLVRHTGETVTVKEPQIWQRDLRKMRQVSGIWISRVRVGYRLDISSAGNWDQQKDLSRVHNLLTRDGSLQIAPGMRRSIWVRLANVTLNCRAQTAF